MSKAKRPQAKYYQRACPRSAHTLLWSLETGRAQDNTRQPDLESVQIDRTRFVTSTQMTLHHTQPTPFIPPPQVLKLRRGKYFTGVSSVFIFLLRQRFFFFWCIFGFIDYPYGKFFRVCVCVCVCDSHSLPTPWVVRRWFGSSFLGNLATPLSMKFIIIPVVSTWELPFLSLMRIRNEIRCHGEIERACMHLQERVIATKAIVLVSNKGVVWVSIIQLLMRTTYPYTLLSIPEIFWG